MSFFKYFIVLLLLYFGSLIFYHNIISPKVTLINNTDYDLELYVTETNSSMSRDPTLAEADDMLNSSMRLKPKDKYSFGISIDGLFSAENTALIISATNRDEEGNLRLDSEPVLAVMKKGFCHYTVNIYEDHTEYDTSKVNICYKRFFLFE